MWWICAPPNCSESHIWLFCSVISSNFGCEVFGETNSQNNAETEVEATVRLPCLLPCMPGRTVEGSMPSQMRISCKDKMSGPRQLTITHPVTVKSFKRWDEDTVEAVFLQGGFSTPRGLLEKEDSSSGRCQWPACLDLGLRSHSMPPVPSQCLRMAHQCHLTKASAALL